MVHVEVEVPKKHVVFHVRALATGAVAADIRRCIPIEFCSASVPPRSFYSWLRQDCVASLQSGFMFRPPLPFFFKVSQVSL